MVTVITEKQSANSEFRSLASLIQYFPRRATIEPVIFVEAVPPSVPARVGLDPEYAAEMAAWDALSDEALASCDGWE